MLVFHIEKYVGLFQICQYMFYIHTYVMVLFCDLCFCRSLFPRSICFNDFNSKCGREAENPL